jgi:Collagen triple helix repeat (20 copies)
MPINPGNATPQQYVISTTPPGESLNSAFTKINTNFTEIFAAGPVLSNIAIANNTIRTTPTNGSLILNPNGIGNVVANAHVIPDISHVRNLGSPTQRWNTVYADYISYEGGNITFDNIDVPGNIQAGGYISAAGNVAGNYIFGNGSQLTGLPASYSNVNVATFLADFGSNVISTTGNVTAGYFIGDGSQLTGLPASYGDSNVVTLLNNFGSNTISTTGTVTAGSFTTSGASGNITGANYITANYFVGDGGLLSNVGALIQSNVAPSDPTSSTMWWDTVSGALYVWYTDMDGSQWVAASPTGVNFNSIASNIVSASNNTFNLGSNVNSWANVYAGHFIGDGSLLSNVGALIQSNVAPSDPTSSTLWWDTTDGSLYVWYTDTSGSQWVAASPTGVDWGNVASNIIPSANNVFSLGNSTHQWASAYLGANTLYLNNVPVGVNGNILTVNGANVVTSQPGGAVSTSGNIVGGNFYYGNGTPVSGSGPQGATGPSGVNGATGATGVAGTNGATGATGVAGTNGATGATGVAGTNGATGATGVAGTNGATGSTGLTGATGPQGATGTAGTNGATGATGVGATGATGPQGATGAGALSSLNYVQVLGNPSSPPVIGAGGTILSLTITTSGGPVELVGCGDAVNSSSAFYGTVRWYRGATALGNPQFFESSGANENQSVAQVVIDTPTAGTYTYYWKMPSSSGSITWGESTAPVISATELQGVIGSTGITGATGPAGATGAGVTGATGPAGVNGATGATGAFAGNLTANLNGQGYSISNVAVVSATGNITGSYLFGNGSQLTGLPATYGNSNVATFMSAYGSNTISTSGNITAGNLIGNISIAGNVVGAQANVGIVAGSYTWTFDNTGNLTIPAGGDILLANTQSTISAAGNITGNYIFGNGSQLTGLPATYGNSNVATFLANFGSNTISTSGNITAGNLIGNISITGNVTGTSTNVQLVAGSYTWTFDNTGNLTLPTNGDISMPGNGAQMTVGGTINSYGNTNGTAFAVIGNGATSNVALGFFPTGNTPAEMAIRDYSTANSTMYFDTTIGSANTGGKFHFRSSNAFTILANINSYGITLPTRPAFRVYGNGVTGGLNTTTNGTGILNANNWAVDYNQGSYLNSSTGYFTAPVAGLYQVNLVARCANNTAPASQVVVIKNYGSGNINQAFWEVPANAGVNHFGVSTVSKLAVGDTLVVRVTQGNISFDINDSWSVVYLG